MVSRVKVRTGTFFDKNIFKKTSKVTIIMPVHCICVVFTNYFDVHESVHRDIITKATNEMQLYRLTLRRLMSYIYGALILDVSRSHTTTQHSR